MDKIDDEPSTFKSSFTMGKSTIVEEKKGIVFSVKKTTPETAFQRNFKIKPAESQVQKTNQLSN